MDKKNVIPECLTEKGRIKEQERKRVMKGILGVLAGFGLGVTVLKAALAKR